MPNAFRANQHLPRDRHQSLLVFPLTPPELLHQLHPRQRIHDRLDPLRRPLRRPPASNRRRASRSVTSRANVRIDDIRSSHASRASASLAAAACSACGTGCTSGHRRDSDTTSAPSASTGCFAWDSVSARRRAGQQRNRSCQTPFRHAGERRRTRGSLLVSHWAWYGCCRPTKCFLRARASSAGAGRSSVDHREASRTPESP